MDKPKFDVALKRTFSHSYVLKKCFLAAADVSADLFIFWFAFCKINAKQKR